MVNILGLLFSSSSAQTAVVVINACKLKQRSRTNLSKIESMQEKNQSGGLLFLIEVDLCLKVQIQIRLKIHLISVT